MSKQDDSDLHFDQLEYSSCKEKAYLFRTVSSQLQQVMHFWSIFKAFSCSDIKKNIWNISGCCRSVRRPCIYFYMTRIKVEVAATRLTQPVLSPQGWRNVWPCLLSFCCSRKTLQHVCFSLNRPQPLCAAGNDAATMPLQNINTKTVTRERKLLDLSSNCRFITAVCIF